MTATDGATSDIWPLTQHKEYAEESEFQPVNLLREARRQKRLRDLRVPRVCLLDPDGDIVRYLRDSGVGRQHEGWACYHTDMWLADLDGLSVGVVGMAVGASFAVLVAEQLSVSGAALVISITSAGRINPRPQLPLPCFLLIERALRDEGTSAHYLPPGRWSVLAPWLRAALNGVLDAAGPSGGESVPLRAGQAWTTDAPYRETATAIEAARNAEIDCVEMEAAALYAYATACRRDVVCLAHITNTMAIGGNDFEKGRHNGALDALAVAGTVARALVGARPGG